MKPSCLKFPCGVSGLSICCNAEIFCGDICKDCGEHTADCCDDCDEFDDGEDIETEIKNKNYEKQN